MSLFIYCFNNVHQFSNAYHIKYILLKACHLHSLVCNPWVLVTSGFATVEFSSDAETDDAMKRNKNFIGPKKVYLYKVKREVKSSEVVEKGRPWENKIKENMETNEEDESIAEVSST